MNLTHTLCSVLVALILVLIAWTAYGQWRINHRYPAVGQFITVEGVRLHYVQAGKGPAIMLVHGASSNLNEFTTSLLPHLAKKYQVIAFDRPGFGHSERPSGEWMDPGRQAELMLKAVAQLGMAKPLVIGHSWAGSVVNAALVHYDEQISAGVSLAGVAGHWAGPLNWTYRVGDLPLIGPLFAWTLVYPLGQFMLHTGLGQVFTPNGVPEHQVEKTALALALRPQSYQHNVRDMNNSNEYLQLLSVHYDQIQKPLLVIHGEKDELVPYWNHGRRLLKVVPFIETVLLANAGHAPHHTHTDAVVAAVDEFYQRVLNGQCVLDGR